MRQRARDRRGHSSGRGLQDDDRRRRSDRSIDQGRACTQVHSNRRTGSLTPAVAPAGKDGGPPLEQGIGAYRTRLASGANLRTTTVALADSCWREDRRSYPLVPEFESQSTGANDSDRRHAHRSHFRQLAGELPQIVWELDPRGRLVYANQRWTEYCGPVSHDGLEAQLARVHPEDVEQVRAAWQAALDAQRAFECEFRLRRRDGEYRWFLCRASPARNRSGRLVRWLASATDVHDLKRAQDIMSQADRCKNEFIAALSHELRNPLLPIRNCLGVLQRAAPGSDEARRAETIIARQVDQLARLVDDLLDVTRISHNVMELHICHVDLSELVRRAAEDHLSLFDQNGVNLELRGTTPAVYVEGDPSRLLQVVGNLLHNAVKFTPPGGSTRVSVERTDSGLALLRVLDSGIGMEPDTLAQLFQPFTRAAAGHSRSKGGLGLGLALVKGLVERHGGDISAYSEGHGSGSEFVVRLPLASPDP